MGLPDPQVLMMRWAQCLAPHPEFALHANSDLSPAKSGAR